MQCEATSIEKRDPIRAMRQHILEWDISAKRSREDHLKAMLKRLVDERRKEEALLRRELAGKSLSKTHRATAEQRAILSDVLRNTVLHDTGVVQI